MRAVWASLKRLCAGRCVQIWGDRSRTRSEGFPSRHLAASCHYLEQEGHPAWRLLFALAPSPRIAGGFPATRARRSSANICWTAAR